MQTPATDDVGQEVVEASFRVLDRMCRSNEHADYLRTKLDGMQVLSSALEAHKNNDKICKVNISQA